MKTRPRETALAGGPWPSLRLPLMSGDRLTQPEFHRRYLAMPEVRHAELVEGVVYMASPLRIGAHGKPHAALLGWLWNYCAATPGVELADNATLILDVDNELQPDVMVWLPARAGGLLRITADDYAEGAPTLIAEVSASSASYDLHDKKRAYRRGGVQEYLVWRVFDQAIDWWQLIDGDYVGLVPGDGMVRSLALPGLVLDVEAMLQGDLQGVMAALSQGLGGEGHRDFVASLAASR